MSIHIIAALDRRGAIGRGGDLLYRIREDLRRFKAITMGGTLVMGRKTWESLPGALPGRRNIVVTRQRGYRAEGAETAASLEEALRMAADGPGDTFIIGGAQIYAQALPYADTLELTLIHDTADGADSCFPPLDLSCYSVTALTPAPTTPPVTFATLKKL